VPFSARQRIELALMAFEPTAFFPKYLHSIDDVAVHRSRVRATFYSEFAVEYLIDLVWARVHESRRRNLIHGLNAIKWVLRNRNERTSRIPRATVDRLFELYQYFIFDRLDQIRWSVSAILKDKTLRTAQLKWLLSHHAESPHIVNRILRYPKYHPLIADWARGALRRPDLAERRSELLGRLIVDAIPPEAGDLPVPSVLWGIYYASAEPETKRKLLSEQAPFEAVDDLIAICIRLGMPEILMRFRNRVKNGP
jgi:hypothetical protein